LNKVIYTAVVSVQSRSWFFLRKGRIRNGARVSFLIRGCFVYFLLLLQIAFYKACYNISFKYAILLHRKS